MRSSPHTIHSVPDAVPRGRPYRLGSTGCAISPWLASWRVQIVAVTDGQAMCEAGGRRVRAAHHHAAARTEVRAHGSDGRLRRAVRGRVAGDGATPRTRRPRQCRAEDLRKAIATLSIPDERELKKLARYRKLLEEGLQRRLAALQLRKLPVATARTEEERAAATAYRVKLRVVA
jgi:hypothetical protein